MAWWTKMGTRPLAAPQIDGKSGSTNVSGKNATSTSGAAKSTAKFPITN